jgi:GT2 family glycosyltransferase
MGLMESPGTIALPTGEIGRFTLFTICLASTMQPAKCNLGISASASVTENLNHIIRGLRDEDEWVWIIGDDHTWTPDSLIRLLAIMDGANAHGTQVDILVPLVTKRNPPWHLVVFMEAEWDDIRGIPTWQPINWEDVPEPGNYQDGDRRNVSLFEVDAAGSAGMLIKREVLDAIGSGEGDTKVWFESTNGTYLNEDVNFCSKARGLGYRIWATADVVMGHIGIFNVRPYYRNGQWGAMTEFSSPEEQFKEIFMPGHGMDVVNSGRGPGE